jgi:hypothetical protein
MPKLSRRDFGRDSRRSAMARPGRPIRGACRPTCSPPTARRKLQQCPRNGLVAPAVRVLGKTVRLRDKEHRKFVTGQPCLVCGRVPSDSHHLHVYTIACTWSQSQRRVQRPGLPDTSPRASSVWGRGCMVAEAQHRSASSRAQTVAAHASRQRMGLNK